MPSYSIDDKGKFKVRADEQDLRLNLPPVEPEQEFMTKDIGLAAVILSKEYGTLVSVDKTDIRRMKFIFSGYNLQAVESSWTNRKVEVNAADFFDAIRKMKSIIHSSD